MLTQYQNFPAPALRALTKLAALPLSPELSALGLGAALQLQLQPAGEVQLGDQSVLFVWARASASASGKICGGK